MSIGRPGCLLNNGKISAMSRSPSVPVGLCFMGLSELRIGIKGLFFFADSYVFSLS
jgi:hypothetical protein